jgi:ATP-dependent helicase HrpB
MLEADLSGLVLTLADWGVTDPNSLRFLDPPPAGAWREAVTLLQSLDAVDAVGRITPEGRALARLPLHPRLAHMAHRALAEGESLVAAELAVLLGERGLGGTDVDLDERLRRFRADRSPRAHEARQLARRWAKGPSREGSAAAAGPHLARAYPDRVAQAAGRPGRFRLANGRSASLDESDALARAPFLVAAEVTGTAANGRIRSAAAISREEIEAEFAAHIVKEETLAFDRGSRSVRARRVRRLGEVRLADAPAPVADLEAAARLLAEGIAGIGLDALPWSREQVGLRARASYLARVAGAPWPDLSDATLAPTAAAWLAPAIHGRIALSEITADDLAAALATLLPWNLQRDMDRLLPSYFEAPSGHRHPIDYAGEAGPLVEVRVQELFGLDAHPTIAGNRVPLLLVLLSPAHRPIQTTRDLPGFWRGSWKDVAKDLKGRYPRHPWPDDPLAAMPTARAKPRGT